MLLLLLLSFSSSLVFAGAKAPLPAGVPVDSNPIPVSNCQFPFQFNNALYYGCTSAGDDKPWCVVPSSASRGPQDWRYCDTNTATAALAKVVGDPKCATGWKNGAETVYGCIANTGNDYGCNPAGTVVKCNVDASVVTAGGGGAAVASSGEKVKSAGLAAGSVNTSTSSSAKKVPVGAIAGGVGGLVAVALLVGLIVMRRNSSRKKSTWSDPKHSPTGGYGGLDVSGPTNSPDDFRFTQDHPGILTANGPPPPVPAEKCYPVVSTYTPTLGDELEIQPGDKVQLVIEYDDGWCQGINLSRGGAKGVFPKHCIDLTAGYY